MHTHCTQVCSAESLEVGGVYLLENGHDAFLYVDKQTPPQLIQVGPRSSGADGGRQVPFMIRWGAGVRCSNPT